jgi:hypothetical protein
MTFRTERCAVGSQLAKSEPMLRMSLMIREQVRPDGWITYTTRSPLGGSLLAQKKYDEVERLILRGCDGMESREVPAPARRRLAEADESVVSLCEAWGRPEQAAARKAKLGQAGHPADPCPRASTGRPTPRASEGRTCRPQ